MLKSPLSARPVIEALEARIAPATFTVTTTADSGPGSLRQAILDANALEGADTIGFTIEGNQLQIISVLSPLPAITDKVTISGAGEQVCIDGTNTGADATGLTITTPAANGSVITALQIANFSGSGLLIDGSSYVVISGNSIFGNGLHGLHIKGGGNTKVLSSGLGGSSGGNKGDGLLIENSDSNLIGISTVGAQSTNGNSVYGNGLFGIEVRGGSGNVITANTISGNGSLAPERDLGGGLAVIDAKSTLVGGSVVGQINILHALDMFVVGNGISGNSGNGVLIKGRNATETTVAGNNIGGNLGDGVRIDGADKTYFGAFETKMTSRGQSYNSSIIGNTIHDNTSWGVAVVNGSTDTVVRASTISGNTGGAVLFENAIKSTVGGYTVYYDNGGSSDSNTISFGAGVGVMVKNSSNIIILGNKFTGIGLPIDLGGDGASTNDPGDADSGANHLQNYPTIGISKDRITASLATDAANTTFLIQAYVFDPATSQYSPLDRNSGSTGPDGVASISINTTAPADKKVFATATNLATGETSEFSTAALMYPLVSIGSQTTTEGNTGVQNLSFTVTLDTPSTMPVKVGYRSTNGTATAGEDYSAVDGFLIFEPGETTKTITVPVFGDPIQEAKETFFVDLTTVENGALTTASQGTGTIINDDAVPTISIQVQNPFVFEGENSASQSSRQYTITLSNPSLDPIEVKLSVGGGTATKYVDYVGFDATVIFAPGVTSVTDTLYISNDTTREETETFQLQLSNPTIGTLGNANAVVTIMDNDTWVIQADAVQIIEGNDGQSLAVMKVRLINSYGVTDHSHPISVDFTTLNGTAVSGSDYVATQGTLTFQPGEFEKTISIPILGDSTAESNESFAVKFSTPLGATLQQASQTVMLLNDDPGAVSVSSASIVEGNSGQKMLVFNLALSVPNTVPVTVDYAAQGGSAQEGVDFESVAGQLSFAPGETQKTISVPIYGDRIGESDETFTLKLTGASGAAIATATATGTILNDDPFINIENAQFLEGQPTTPGTRSVYLPVRLSQATDIPVTVDFSTSNGTAEASSDYIASSGTVTFAAGQTLQYIELQIVGDLTLEPDETFSVKLSNPHGAEIGTDTGVVTIKADEPFISAQDVTIAEGHSGTKSLVFTVNLSQAQNSAVTVDYTTADGTATAGSDYTAVAGTLTFVPGETTKVVSVPILGDTAQEADEIVKLLLSNAAGVSLATAEVHGTIANDDSPESLPVLSIANASVTEGHFGTSSLVFTFSLSKSSTSAVSVQYSTADGTATAGSDYTATFGTLTFAPGETTKVVSVPILGDTAQEADEIVKLLLSNAAGVSLATAEVHGTIANDDSPESLPVLSIANASVTEGHFGTSSLVFTFSLSKSSTSAVSVQYSTADGTATAGSDYTATFGTLTFAPGETTKTVSVPISGDQQVEDNETLQLLLSGVNGAVLGTTEATGFILNDDSTTPQILPTLSVHGGSVYEGYTGIKPLIFTVTLSEASAWPVSVHYSTVGGTGYASTDSYSDYLPTSGLVTFAPGETSKTVEVSIHGDVEKESNETVDFSIWSPTGATISTSQATGTILNDDLNSSDVGLIISKAGKGKYKTTWRENDGDLVTLISNYRAPNLSFGYDADGHTMVQRVDLRVGGQQIPIGLQFTVQKSLTGDGKINVDEIITSTDLLEVTIPGRLGSVIAGDTKLKTPAIRKLTVDSFGLDSALAEAGAEPLQSKVNGSIGSFTVKGDFTGANLIVTGGSFGSLTIGGNLQGTSSATATGLYVEKGLNKLQVDGDIRGTDSAHPVVIRTAGFPDHPTETLHRVVVGGDVVNTNLLAGTTSPVGVRVGDILVNGNWTASNLVVGAGAGSDGFFGTEDDIATQDTASRIARITIRGAISGTAEADSGTDHFGFVAGRIAAFQVGAQKLDLSSKWKDSMEVGSTFDVMLRELAGRSRA